ncbi:MAG: hypothetical protein QMD50_02290 [Patescibacteria group bacterium]|nr:hypothetical protein [Patescibacteria group bacterium]
MKRKKIVLLIFALVIISLFFGALIFATPQKTKAQFFPGIAPFGGKIAIANVPPIINCGGSVEVFSIAPTGLTTPVGPYVILPSTKRYGIWSQTFGVAPLPPRAIKGIYGLITIPCTTNTLPPAPAGFAYPIILFGTSLL